MNAYKEEWLNQEKQFWKKSGFAIHPLENGFFVKKGVHKFTSVWNESVFEGILPFFSDCSFLHAYSVCKNEGSPVYYFDFKWNVYELRFTMEEREQGLSVDNFKILPDEDYLDAGILNTNELEELCKKLKKTLSYFVKLPKYRLRFVSGYLEDPSSLLENLDIFQERKIRALS